MSLAVLKQETLVAFRFTEEIERTIRDMYCRDLDHLQFEVFKHVCNRTGLDPSRNQIYPIVRSVKQKDGSKKPIMTIQTGIDGFRLIAERTGKYAPGPEPTYVHDGQGRLISATSFVRKQTVDGTWHLVASTAYFKEYCQTDFDGNPLKFWKQMPHGQLAKCAEALALRKAFPADFSGLYTSEEMEQADNPETSPCSAEKIEKKISHEQAIQIKNLQSELDSESKHKIWVWIGNKYKINRIEDILQENYEKILINFQNGVKFSAQKKLEVVNHQRNRDHEKD